MISFLLRLVFRAAVVQRYRFLSLTCTIAIASAVIVILSTLYLNAESHLTLELSGVPNMIVEPQKSFVDLTRLTIDDVHRLKSLDHFWRNNVVNAAPIQLSEIILDGKQVKVAGSWFDKESTVESETYHLGILRFKGWHYAGEMPDSSSIILGKNMAAIARPSDMLEIRFGKKSQQLRVAGVIETGSFWDDVLFMHLGTLQRLTGDSTLDRILVSSLIKPRDELAIKAELYGENALAPEEYEAWFCSPYTSSIAFSIKDVIPYAETKIQRRITEVQEGLIKTSSAVFAALFVLTLIGSVMAIYSAEKMYIAGKSEDFGILSALGASRQKAFSQIVLEMLLASLLSVAITYLIGWYLSAAISSAVFGVRFIAGNALLLASALSPLLLTSLVAAILLRKTLERNVTENLCR